MKKSQFEMPTPCQHCGEIFDLNDGYGSEKWYPNTTICEQCHEEEDQEVEEDERWENINVELSNALYGLDSEKDLWNRLDEENKKLLKKLLSHAEVAPKELYVEKNCSCCATGTMAFPNCERCKGTGVIQDLEVAPNENIFTYEKVCNCICSDSNSLIIINGKWCCPKCNGLLGVAQNPNTNTI